MIVPFIVEAQSPVTGEWEPKALANSESAAQDCVRAGKSMRRIQGVRVGEWRVVYVPKEEWS